MKKLISEFKAFIAKGSVLDLAVDAGHVDVVVLDAHRGFGLQRDEAVQVHAQSARHRARAGVVKMSVSKVAVSPRFRSRLRQCRRGDSGDGDSSDKNVTHCFY